MEPGLLAADAWLAIVCDGSEAGSVGLPCPLQAWNRQGSARAPDADAGARQAHSDEQSNVRMRLDKAERAIEAERATVCELRRRLAAAEQVPPAPLRRSPPPPSRGAPGTRAGPGSPSARCPCPPSLPAARAAVSPHRPL